MGRGGWVMAMLFAMGCSRSGAPDAGNPQLAVLHRADRCAERIPADVRAALLSGWEEHAPQQLGSAWVDDPLVCAFAQPTSGARLTLTFDCRHRAKDREVEAVRERILEEQGTELTGIGRAALRAKPTGELEQLTAWDDDSPCTLTVTWAGEGREQAVALLRPLLTPDTAAPPAQPSAPLDTGDAGDPPSPPDAGTPVIAPHLLEP